MASLGDTTTTKLHSMNGITSGGNVDPTADNAYNLGESNLRWKNGYFTNINGVTVGSSPKFTDTNTHYTTRLHAGTGTAANAATTNGNTKLAISDDNTVRTTVTLKGSGATTVTSDSAGVITISSTDTNTDTNTHWTTRLHAGDGTAANKATTNGNTKLAISDDNTVRTTLTIKGTGATTVTSDSAGVITINSTDTNTDTNTHWTTRLHAGTGSAANAAATNGNVKLAVSDDNTVRTTVTIKGTGATTVTSDTTGVITINSTDTNTDTNNRKSFFGTCATAAGTAEKAVTLSDTAGWELKAGTIVGVKFTNTNTAGSAKLNVNSSGAKSIWYGNAVYTGTAGQITGHAGYIIYYMYDGTNWVFLNHSANYIDSHWTTHMYAGDGTAANVATTNGNTKLSVADNTSIRNSITIKGTGATTVTSDSAGVITINSTDTNTNTDVNVTQTNTTASADYRVLFSVTADDTTRTEGARKSTNMKFNPSTGNLQVTRINGVTVGSSPKFTDTNTWRGIQDNLTSTSTTESLSAAQGKYLWENLIRKDGSLQYKNNVTDLNTFYTGITLTNSASNRPVSDMWCLVISAGENGTTTQFVKNLWDDTSFYRCCASGTWSAWQRYKHFWYHDGILDIYNAIGI